MDLVSRQYDRVRISTISSRPSSPSSTVMSWIVVIAVTEVQEVLHAGYDVRIGVTIALTVRHLGRV